MFFRCDWLRFGNLGVAGKTWSRRRAHKKHRTSERRARFFERLEERLVLNGIPIAKEDLGYSTTVNSALVVTSQTQPLLANDWDPEGSSLTASVVGNPANGALSSFVGSAGTFTYTPNSGFSGIDTFTGIVTGSGGSKFIFHREKSLEFE